MRSRHKQLESFFENYQYCYLSIYHGVNGPQPKTEKQHKRKARPTGGYSQLSTKQVFNYKSGSRLREKWFREKPAQKRIRLGPALPPCASGRYPLSMSGGNCFESQRRPPNKTIQSARRLISCNRLMPTIISMFITFRTCFKFIHVH